MTRKAGRRGKGEGSILQRSDGRWIAQVQTGYNEDGRPKYAQRSAKTQKEAIEKLDALKREIFSGVYTDTKVTLKAYLEEWLETKKGQIEPKTLEGYTRTAKHLMRHLGGVQLSKLSSQQIQRSISAIRDESAAVVKDRNKGVAKAGAGVRTANQCRTNLHTALEDAVTAVPPLLMRNPVAATKTLKAESEEVVIWMPNQMATFLEVARESPLYALFVMAVGSGLRRGELLGLKWKDIGAGNVSVQQTVKLENNKIIIGTPKTKSSRRRVPVSEDVLAALNAHREAQAAHQTELVLDHSQQRD